MSKTLSSLLKPMRIALFAIICLLSALIIWGDQGLYQREKLRFLKSSLKQSEAELSDSINLLRQEREMLKNKRIIENVIRKELGFIRDNEIIYRLIKKEVKTIETPSAE